MNGGHWLPEQDLRQLLGVPGSSCRNKRTENQPFIIELTVKTLHYQRKIDIRGGCTYYFIYVDPGWFHIKFKEGRFGHQIMTTVFFGFGQRL